MIGTRFPGHEEVPRGAQAGLIIVHGIAEHSARYRHASAALAARKVATFVYDQRGHGEYPGARTHVEDFADFAADLQMIGANAGGRRAKRAVRPDVALDTRAMLSITRAGCLEYTVARVL